MTSTALATSVAHRHPIQVVSRRTGLSADVIRAWEKRYGVVRPARSESGRRLYSDADVERLRLISRASLTGRSVAHVAALPADELMAMVQEASSSAAPVARPDTPNRWESEARAELPLELQHLRYCLDEVARFDATGLDAALRRASVALPHETFLEAIVMGLSERVADGVQRDTLRPAHQHLTQVALRRVLDRVTEAASLPRSGPSMVIATPPGQNQELGAFLTAAAAATEGWRVLYLGAGLTAEDIAQAATQTRARAVAMSLGTTASNRVVPGELRRLRDLLPNDVAIVVEGAGADAHRGVLREIGAAPSRDVPTLLRLVRDLRTVAPDEVTERSPNALPPRRT